MSPNYSAQYLALKQFSDRRLNATIKHSKTLNKLLNEFRADRNIPRYMQQIREAQAHLNKSLSGYDFSLEALKFLSGVEDPDAQTLKPLFAEIERITSPDKPIRSLTAAEAALSEIGELED